MTDIRKAAEERYPHWLPPEPGTPDPDYSEVDASWQNEMADDQRNAFVAGAEWMREEAARVVADWSWRISLEPICQDCSYTASEALAAAIRKIGESDE